MSFVPFGHLDTSHVEKQFGAALVVTGDARTLQQLAMECASFLHEHQETAWIHVYYYPAGSRLVVATINRQPLTLHALIMQRISEGVPVELVSGTTFIEVNRFFANHPPQIDLEDLPEPAF